MRTVIIIPALNEEAAIGGVVSKVRDRVDQVIVVDNGSTDQTADRATKAGAGSVATGGAVLLGGFIVLLMSAVYGLSNVVEPWLAALIVGAVVVVIGMIMVSSGKKKFQASSFKPERTIHSVNKDKEAVKGHTS